VADLVVLADEIPDPALVASLRADGAAHLAVRLRDGIGVVGPLVLPGRTACLGCLDLARSALDARWPVVAARLIGRAGAADPSCVTATVGLAVAQAVAAMEGGRPPTLDATLELNVGTGTLVRRHWAAHPECPCGVAGPPGELAHDAAARASWSEGDTIMR
jgi:bacteriocin biosynthesis cyclodehydratase domain-containing protein